MSGVPNRGKMFGSMLLGVGALYGLYQLYRHTSDSNRDQEAEDNKTLQENPLPESQSWPSCSITSDWNSGSNNKDSISQSDRKQICYHEYYPSLSTTKMPSDVSRQSEYGNKFIEGSNGSFARVKNSIESPPSFSNYPSPSSAKLPESKPSLAKPASASSTSFLSASKPLPSSSSTSSSFSKPAIPSSKPASPLPKPASPEPPLFTFDQPRSSAKAPTSPSSSYSSPSMPTPSSPNGLPSSKPTLSPLHSDSTNQQGKADYTWVEKGTSPIYMIPEDIENMIKKDIVPDVLKKPLSPFTYKDFFAALLYAEDFYIQKWNDFHLEDVKLVLHEAAINDKPPKNKNLKGSAKKDDKIFVALEIDSVPERRPILLSRDFVFARRAGGIAKEFKGIIYKVEKSTTLLVEFGDEFYSQHRSDSKYDISFSFNRACLKRAHQAIAAASDPLFRHYIFPDCTSCCNTIDHQGQLPYLIEGPLCVDGGKLSKTALVVQDLVLKFYRKASKSRILICAPMNRTCDDLLASLKKEIPESDMFRANAAFREVFEVPDDILPLCRYERECFSCPSLRELRQYRVIFSTFTSSFRLHTEGITAGHFSHIFLLDASSATEPQAMIALSNLANENTNVIVTGAPSNRSRWVRSDIARRNGLSKSYFERLRATKTYSSSNTKFFRQL